LFGGIAFAGFLLSFGIKGAQLEADAEEFEDEEEGDEEERLEGADGGDQRGEEDDQRPLLGR
jgi:hypothetical protein